MTAEKTPYGLLGRKLGHSYSPRIHALFGDYAYGLFEVEPEDVEAFVTKAAYRGINVTVPYKETVMPYCDEISDAAKKIGCVNVIVRTADGRLVGDNTDYYGFSYLLTHAGIDVTDRKAIILGSGGASKTVHAVLADRGAREIVTISRSGEHTYETIADHYDADVIVNTTPVGMYPTCPAAPLDLEPFAACGELREGFKDGLRGVVDVVYNPARTGLMLQAEKLGVPYASGLPMLVAQAKGAAELFLDTTIAQEAVDSAVQCMAAEFSNIVLIGMPSSGKSTIGSMLAQRLGRTFIDIDDLIPERAGASIADIFAKQGEEAFRAIETQATSDACKQSGRVIACGGGVITRPHNYDLLHQNGVIVLLDRPLELLISDGRPMSITKGIPALAHERSLRYHAWADIVIENDEDAEAVVERVLAALDAYDFTAKGDAA